nr:immunoglobulin light chain junction region [Macaca mulatta]
CEAWDNSLSGPIF